MTRKVHWFLGLSFVFMLVLGFGGCALTQVHILSIGHSVAFSVVIGGMLFLPAAYAHKAGRKNLKDCIVFLYWAFAISAAIAPCVDFAARMRRPLENAHLTAIDRALGVNISAIHAWAGAHKEVAALLAFTYARMGLYLVAAVIVPIATGKGRRAQEFFTANVFGLLLMLPLSASVPAVGPWYGYHFAPSAVQAGCQKDFLLMRTAGPICTPAIDGIIALPSMHVFWAVVCAYALCCILWLRIPAILFSVLIVLSTMTMGWHYFCDVLSGLLMAAICIVAARHFAILRPSQQESDADAHPESDKEGVTSARSRGKRIYDQQLRF